VSLSIFRRLPTAESLLRSQGTLCGIDGEQDSVSDFSPSYSVSVCHYDIFINCNWGVTRWQQYSTHLHTNSKQNDTINNT